MRRYRAKLKKLSERELLEKRLLKLTAKKHLTDLSNSIDDEVQGVTHSGVDEENWPSAGKSADDLEYSDNAINDEYMGNVINDGETEDNALLNLKNSIPLAVHDTDVLADKLKYWSIRHRLSHACIGDLLKILKLWFVKLPSDSRTLLGTETDFKVDKVAGGDYVHISVQHALPLALKRASIKPEQLVNATLKLQLNFDGVPMFASSNYSVWPVLAKAVEPIKTKVFAVGIFGGKKKPNTFNDYLRPLVNELNCIASDGGLFLEILKIRVPLAIHNIVCDAPAKCSVRNVHSFNFRYGCDRCKVRGNMIEHRMTFKNMRAEPRLDTDFDKPFHSDCEDDEYRMGHSILREAGVGMVSQFPHDYMHLVLLGTVRNMVTKLHSGRHNGRLTAAVISDISEHMAECASFIPKEFQRRCRTLFESARWKATECRQFLLYSGPVVLCNTGVSRKQYENFLYLSVSIRCLCSTTLISKYMDFVRGALEYFVDQFAEIYGEKHIVYNVHSLCHLVSDAERYGILDNFSCFEYENFLGLVKELTHKRKTSHIVQQICRRLSERDYLVTSSSQFAADKRHGVPQQQHSDGPTTAGYETCMQYYEIVWNDQLIKLKDSDNVVMLDGDVCIVRNILKLTDQSTSVFFLYELCGVRTDFFTLPLNPAPDFIGNVFHSGDIGIWIVSSGTQNHLQISNIAKFSSIIKCVRLPSKKTGEFVAMPMLHTM